ncbi:hypothetical protein ACFY2M_45740, partial [Streptomyces sp. NPDC001276]
MAAFGVAGTLVDRSGAAIVCFIASLARALLVAGAAAVLVVLPPGTAETVTVMALAAVTGALTQFSFIANEAVGAIVSRRTDGQTHKVQSVLIGIDQTATLIGPALGGAPGWGWGWCRPERGASVSGGVDGRARRNALGRGDGQATQGQQLLTAKRRRRPASGPRTAPAPPTAAGVRG